jgi:hypothetical protein
MWIKLCGGALLCAVASLLIKGSKGDVLPVQWTGILVLSGASLVLWQPVLEWLGELCAAHGLDKTAQLLFKGLGVGVLTQLCADSCRQSGEGHLANGVEMAGRAEILLLCLPMLRDLVGMAEQLLGGV